MAGEALGLEWNDIDLSLGTLRVNPKVQRIGDGGVLVFSEPKNSSRHTIDLPQRATEALRSHRKRQAEDYLNTGDKAVAGTLIFVALVAISIQAVVYLSGS